MAQDGSTKEEKLQLWNVERKPAKQEEDQQIHSFGQYI
jgi:hypothetical protein